MPRLPRLSRTRAATKLHAMLPQRCLLPQLIASRTCAARFAFSASISLLLRLRPSVRERDCWVPRPPPPFRVRRTLHLPPLSSKAPRRRPWLGQLLIGQPRPDRLRLELPSFSNSVRRSARRLAPPGRPLIKLMRRSTNSIGAVSAISETAARSRIKESLSLLLL